MEKMNKLFLPFIFADALVLIIGPEEWRKSWENNYIIGAFLTDLWRAFNCIPHDLTLCLLDLTKIDYICINTKKREQCLSDNNIKSSLGKKNISGDPPKLNFGSISLNIFLMAFLFYISRFISQFLQTTMHFQVLLKHTEPN